MKNTLIGLAVCAAAPFVEAASTAGASDSRSTQQVIRAGSQAPMAGPADYFTGQVRVDPLYAATADINASAAYVSFEPGARSAWHTHPAGQRLLVTSGVGLVQEWGKPIQEIRPGDVVVCPPGVKHWHGAVSSSPMTHLAITGTVNGKNVDWLEKVSDAQYQAAAQTSRNVQSEWSQPPASETLSTRQQTIAPIGAAMASSNMPRLNAALNQGLDAGLTVSEAKEILVQLYAYSGFPRSLNALNELKTVVEARQQRGVKDEPGREPQRAIPIGDRLLAAGKANQTIIAGAPVQGPLFDFVPVINQYLQAHLFGDIFERDNLDWQSRELATVGALAATPGAQSQLRSHIAASLRVGLTAAQLQQAGQRLTEQDEAEAGKRVIEALASVQGRQPG